MPQHSASILWSPSHTPGLVTLSANLVVLQSDVRHGLVDLERLGQGLEAATYQGRRLARGLYGQNKMTFHWDMWISLIQDLANNPEINSCLQHLHISQLALIRDEWWNYSTSKETELLSVKECQGHDMHTCRCIQRRHRTPGLGTLGTNVVVYPVDVHDGLVDLQCLGQGLEAATDQGWRLDFKRPTDKTLDLQSSDQRTFNLTKTCKSLWLNPCKNTPEINSSLQHLHIWQLALNRDEWWNYRTSKPSKLVTVTGCRKHNIMTCSSIQRFSGAHPTHQALAPSAPILLCRKSIFVTDAFVFSASAKAWKQRQIKAGVFIQGSTVQIVITEIRRTRDI